MKITDESKTSKGQIYSQVTPELVREISDQVYALLLRELKLERERRRWFFPRARMKLRR
jgi:hypothetical protein